MNLKNKFKVTILLFLIVIILTLLILIKIPQFMSAYESCKDDFEVIEKCGCLPFEGDYSYFKSKPSLGIKNVSETINTYINTKENE